MQILITDQLGNIHLTVDPTDTHMMEHADDKIALLFDRAVHGEIFMAPNIVVAMGSEEWDLTRNGQAAPEINWWLTAAHLCPVGLENLKFLLQAHDEMVAEAQGN